MLILYNNNNNNIYKYFLNIGYSMKNNNYRKYSIWRRKLKVPNIDSRTYSINIYRFTIFY